MRGVAVLLGLVLILLGMVHTFVTWTVDGWTVLAAVGVGLVANDLRIEAKEEDR